MPIKAEESDNPSSFWGDLSNPHNHQEDESKRTFLHLHRIFVQQHV